MSQPSPATTTPTPILGPQQAGEFTYVGEMIPNQVMIQNLGTAEAQYWLSSGLEGGPEGWKYYGTVEAGRTASIWVEWPNGRATFFNRSEEASIEIGGDGIFPYDPNTGEAVKG